MSEVSLATVRERQFILQAMTPMLKVNGPLHTELTSYPTEKERERMKTRTCEIKDHTHAPFNERFAEVSVFCGVRVAFLLGVFTLIEGCWRRAAPSIDRACPLTRRRFCMSPLTDEERFSGCNESCASLP